MDEDTTFDRGDWRTASPLFQGETFRRNLEMVRELARFASEDLGCSVSQLAIAWVVANPAVHVAIVGARRAAHIEDSVSAVAVELSDERLARIAEIVADAPRAPGPHPEMMPG